MSYMNKRNPAMKVLVDLPSEEYHALPRLGHSDVLRLHKSPIAYRHSKENPPDSDLKPLVIGSAVHAAVLEPEDFARNFEALPPDIDGQGPRTKHYKETLDRMKWERPSRKWLSQHDYELILQLAESALAHPILQSFIDKPHKVEGTAYFKTWRCPCKCRPDLVAFRGGRKIDVLDLKTCQDASPEGFAKAAAKWGYDVQAEFYRKGLESNNLRVGKFVFLAIEKTPPFSVGAYELHPDDLTTARNIIRNACATYMDCRERDVWPGYGDGLHKLRLPPWRVPNQKTGSTASVDLNWFTVKQIAGQSGLHAPSVYRILERIPKIKKVKFGGRLLIEIDSWEKNWLLSEGSKRKGKKKTETEAVNGATTLNAIYEETEKKKVQDADAKKRT